MGCLKFFQIFGLSEHIMTPTANAIVHAGQGSSVDIDDGSSAE